jgi:hypothetical protein
MTSNTLGMEVQPDVAKSNDEVDDKESKGVMSDDIKHEESDEVTGDHEEHQVATREIPMWIKRMAEGLKDENNPKLSPPMRSS